VSGACIATVLFNPNRHLRRTTFAIECEDGPVWELHLSKIIEGNRQMKFIKYSSIIVHFIISSFSRSEYSKRANFLLWPAGIQFPQLSSRHSRIRIRLSNVFNYIKIGKVTSNFDYSIVFALIHGKILKKLISD